MTEKTGWQENAAELPMLDVYMPMMKAAAIISAGRLGLFETLADGPCSVRTLAKAVGASEVGVESLAEFLVAVGYLEKRDDTFAKFDADGDGAISKAEFETRTPLPKVKEPDAAPFLAQFDAD